MDFTYIPPTLYFVDRVPTLTNSNDLYLKEIMERLNINLTQAVNKHLTKSIKPGSKFEDVRLSQFVEN